MSCTYDMDHCLISDLIPGDDNPRICVRLSRLWEFFDTRDESVLLHVGLVLIDETGDSIAAQIYPPNDEAFRNILAEGKAYYFTYYRVKPASRTYRPVANSLDISFTKWTTVDEYIEPPEKFPRYTFAPRRFDEFPPLVDRKDSFIDTIGIVTGVSALTSVHSRTRNGASSKRNVFLRDANNNTTHISLWGERATEFPADDVHRKGQKDPVIIIFVGTLVKSFKGEVYLSGNNACKWYINFECPESDVLRSSMKESYGGITWIELPTSSTVRAVAKEKTVLEIKDLHPFIHKKGEFIVTVTIRKIDGNWWYVSCDRSKKTAKRYGRGYRCGDKDCPPLVSASPRLKLAVIAVDDTTDTNFVLFGRVAQRLIGKSIDLLLDQNHCDMDFIPREITDLLEKQFKFNVSFTDTTLSSGIVSFQVNYIVTGDITENPLLLSPSASQASSAVPLLTLSPAPSESQSIGQPSTIHAASVGLSSPPLTPTKGIEIASESSSKMAIGKLAEKADQEDVTATIADIKSTSLPAGNSTTKTSKKSLSIGARSRPSPGSNTVKKLFKDDDEAAQEESDK